LARQRPATVRRAYVVPRTRVKMRALTGDSYSRLRVRSPSRKIFALFTWSSCRGEADFPLAVRVTWDPAWHPHTVLAAP